MSVNFPFDAITSLSFTSRPKPLSATLRPLYRVAVLVLVLRLNCSKGKASLLKLQFFNWILKCPELRNHIMTQAKDQSVFNLEIIHMDPMVNLALKYACADGLVNVTKTSYELTEKGRHFADAVLSSNESILASEHEFLSQLGTRISEIKLKRDLGI